LRPQLPQAVLGARKTKQTFVTGATNNYSSEFTWQQLFAALSQQIFIILQLVYKLSYYKYDTELAVSSAGAECPTDLRRFG